MSDLYRKIKGKIETLRECLFVILDERAQLAVDLAAGGLDPYNLRAVVRQAHGTIRGGDITSQIQHTDSIKRSCHLTLPLFRTRAGIGGGD